MDGDKENEVSMVCTGWVDGVEELREWRIENDSGCLTGTTQEEGCHLLSMEQRRKSRFCEKQWVQFVYVKDSMVWEKPRKIPGDFLRSPVVKTSPSNAGGAVFIPGWELRSHMPKCGLKKKKKNIKQKQRCKKNSIKPIKMFHITHTKERCLLIVCMQNLSSGARYGLRMEIGEFIKAKKKLKPWKWLNVCDLCLPP